MSPGGPQNALKQRHGWSRRCRWFRRSSVAAIVDRPHASAGILTVGRAGTARTASTLLVVGWTHAASVATWTSVAILVKPHTSSAVVAAD